MTPQTDIPDLARARRDGAVVVDVREPSEYVAGHVPGALNVPLSTVASRAGGLPDGRLYVVCASGGRSKAATDVLRRAGRDAVSVAGGTQGWVAAGNPVTAGSQP
ncbi:rhodanese-like domain-containing protein [Aquipuribacter nitratireducens]|uniref:Rhodanese-like domain-containing protein n=1 Tax=Aquipuribacter nitratireducens TaxID=650104 RepID=A0ABW0GHF4_9MICO